jgi:hypothetical protein
MKVHLWMLLPPSKTSPGAIFTRRARPKSPPEATKLRILQTDAAGRRFEPLFAWGQSDRVGTISLDIHADKETSPRKPT